MRYIKYIVLTCLSVLMSCSLNSNLINSQNELTTFIVDKDAINKGVLRIHLPQNKPKNLAIKTPKGEWFIIQDHEESIEIMPQGLFESLNKMEFKLDKLEGITWRESKKVIELIFKNSGDYLIYFADNLETESENTFSLQELISFK